MFLITIAKNDTMDHDDMWNFIIEAAKLNIFSRMSGTLSVNRVAKMLFNQMIIQQIFSPTLNVKMFSVSIVG